MKYQKPSQGIAGGWVKASEVTNGVKAKLVSEVTPIEGEYGMQDVGKLRIQGTEESKNVRVNKPSLAGLIDAFGDDSKEWINKVLTLHTEKMIVSGKRVTALYLIPDGYALTEDEGGYLVVGKMGNEKEKTVEYPEEDINPDDIPF